LKNMKIAIASDHAGYDVKEKVLRHLESAGHQVVDCGASSAESVDYPQYAAAAAQKVSSGECEQAVEFCGTGIGMSIVANKFPGVRAATCCNTFTTEMARRHNNANILCLGARALDLQVILELVDLFLKTPFEGGRHTRRVEQISEFEK